MKIGDDKIKRIIYILLYIILLISVSTPNIASSVLKEQIQPYSSGEKYQFMEIPIIPEMIDNKNPLKLNVIENLPDSFSWKNYQGKDWATPAKDQGYCGCCWAFAAIGTLESMFNFGENIGM